MSVLDLTARLRRHDLLQSAPEAELEWLAAHSLLRCFEEGEVATAGGKEVGAMFVVLSGHLAIDLERAYGRRRVMEWRAGDVTGVLPYSRMGASPGDVRAVEPTDVLMLPSARVPELPLTCPALTGILVHVMTDRARRFTSSDLHDQRTLALGKVAAGLAHELNNPASALIRGAKSLVEIVDRMRGPGGADARLALGKVDPATLEAVSRLFGADEAGAGSPGAAGSATGPWSPLERVDREEALEAWLEGSGEDPEVASILADSSVALDDLFALTNGPGDGAALAAVGYAARTLAMERLALELEASAVQIFELVSAVKRFSHLDQTMAEGPVDLGVCVRDAAALLASRAREATVDLVLELAPEPSLVTGVVEELNQLLHSLLENALDAAAPGGRVEVATEVRDGRVRVEVRDDGPGIPEGIRDRIFDPFFTTRAAGRGVGLGLALVRRVVDEHRGRLELESRPGRTVFRVELDRAIPEPEQPDSR